MPRTDHKVPNRDSFDIRDIPDLLGSINVLQINGPREALITLSGSIGDEMLNTSLTGVNFYDVLEEREKPLLEYLLTLVTDHPCAGSSTMLGTVVGSNVTATHCLSVPFIAKDGFSKTVLVFQQFNTMHADRFSNINKSTDAINVTHFDDINNYDIGYGLPEDDGTIASYQRSLRGE